ncbi:MAG: lipoyl synthase [Desulfobacterales bacterium]
MIQPSKSTVFIQKPDWLKRRLPTGPAYENIKGMIGRDRLHTVCQEAKCPNMWECFSHHTATFLIMGSKCTRNCRFCSVPQGALEPPDPEEPARIARVAQEMGLRYVVITSVTRDDLSDGGAAIFAETITAIRRQIPEACVEVLIPDFQGSRQALYTVLQAEPDVLNHNIETVPRLYPRARPQANDRRSLKLIQRAQRFAPDRPTKSGLMLGLGMRRAGCRILTLGQYLQPSKNHLAVERFIAPQEFETWRKKALKMGFAEVASGPFVRSSYHAHELFQKLNV